MTILRLLLAALVVGSLSGCVIDKTSRSASYLMQERIDNNRTRVHTLEKDIAVTATRVDDMEERAANARRRLADSGATLETFLEELQSLRGEVADLRHDLGQSREDAGAVNFRLAALEARLTHMEKELDITPPLILPPMPAEEPAEADSGTSEGGDAADAGDVADAGASEPAEVPPVEDPPDEPAGEPTAAVTEPEGGLGASEGIVMEDERPSEEDALFQSALVLVKKKDWEKAGSRLQRFLRDHPDGEHAVEAQFLIAQCLFELERYKGAITTWQKVIERDEDGPWAPKSMFMQGLSFEELGTKEDLEAARVFFAELVRLYPDAPDAERAKTRLEVLGGP